MKKLLVLANGFPYGTWEQYMETEEGYYSRFDRAWIASLQLRSEHSKTIRTLKSGAEVIPVAYKSRLFYLVNSLTVLADKQLYKEIADLKRAGKLSMSRIVDLFVFLSRAHHEARVIDRALKNEEKDNLLIYSYRFEYQPYVAILLKNKWGKMQHIVSRAHGYDLYEDRHASNYIPLRSFILNNIDYVFPCSKYGVEYIKRNYAITKAKIACRYLGTVDRGEKSYKKEADTFRIVSCSNVIKVKRLEKIVNALSMIRELRIEWTHYGDGPLLDEIRKMAKDKLGDNVKAVFSGNVANQELLRIYGSRDFDIFLNVSSSEGLPVSIMEAMSFGIPCIATNVGGTSEIVNDENGILLQPDAEDREIAEAVVKISAMDRNEYLMLRARARTFWNSHFNSDSNYSAFADELNELCQEKIQ